MSWRAPNNARAMRAAARDDREPWLGEVIGQLEPMQPLPPRTYGPLSRKQAVIGWCAFAAWVAVVLSWIWLAFFVLAKPAAAQPFSEAQIRSDCRRDALWQCPKQWARCALREDDECRAAMIACMIGRKAKLSPNCQRHIW